MTLAKTVVTGTVYRAPEERFTQNNVQVSSFVLNIGDREEMLLRVIVKRTALSELVSQISQNDRVLVEGRLQITTVKNDNGTERRIYEIDANTIELMGTDEPKIATAKGKSESSSFSSDSEQDITKFSEKEFSNELMSDEEIPF